MSAVLVTYESRVALPFAIDMMRWCSVGSEVFPLLPRVVGAGKSCEGVGASSSLSYPCYFLERLRGYAKKQSTIVFWALDSTSLIGSIAHVFTLSPTATCAMSRITPSANLCLRDTAPCTRSLWMFEISDTPAIHRVVVGNTVVRLCIMSHLASVCAAAVTLLSTSPRMRRCMCVAGGYTSELSGVLSR